MITWRREMLSRLCNKSALHLRIDWSISAQVVTVPLEPTYHAFEFVVCDNHTLPHPSFPHILRSIRLDDLANVVDRWDILSILDAGRI